MAIGLGVHPETRVGPASARVGPVSARVGPASSRSVFRASGCTLSSVPCWNVNLPKLPAEEPPTGVGVAPLSTDPLPIAYEDSEGEEGSITLTYSGNYHQRTITPGTDVAVTFAGGIAVSQL